MVRNFSLVNLKYKNYIKVFLLFLFFTSGNVGITKIRNQTVTLKDMYGNKYTFTQDSVNCGQDLGEYFKQFDDVWGAEYLLGVKKCIGSAIKTDIAGNRSAEEFEERNCSTSVNDLLCVAAVKLGHF